MSRDNLPQPDHEALAHSQQLCRHLKQRLQAQGGSMPFAEYMHAVLYSPGLGYYSAGSHKIGAPGDFTTAPEVSPLFGRTIAQSLATYFIQHPEDSVLELGPGSGRLAVDVLQALHEAGAVPQHYYLLEVSADLKQRQQAYVQQQLPAELAARCVWLERLPDTLAGVILANEVLDALAVDVFAIQAGQPRVAAVTLTPEGDWHTVLSEPTEPLLQRLRDLQRRYNLADGYQSEINLWQESLLRTLAQLLQRGLMLFIDYGFPAHEYYHPDRRQGTLCCHYRHRVHHDPFLWSGLQDITAHVDFTALATCGLAAGLSLALYTSQADFLMQLGILDRAYTKASDALLFQQSQALQVLLAPHEMGELFKVMAFYKNTANIFAGLAEQDRRPSL